MLLLCGAKNPSCEPEKCKFKHTVLIDHVFSGGILHMIRRLIDEKGYFTMTCKIAGENVRVYSAKELGKQD